MCRPRIRRINSAVIGSPKKSRELTGSIQSKRARNRLIFSPHSPPARASHAPRRTALLGRHRNKRECRVGKFLPDGEILGGHREPAESEHIAARLGDRPAFCHVILVTTDHSLRQRRNPCRAPDHVPGALESSLTVRVAAPPIAGTGGFRPERQPRNSDAGDVLSTVFCACSASGLITGNCSTVAR